MDDFSVRDLVMGTGDVALIKDAAKRKQVLQTIEESAKARGDLAVANDAHYELRVIQSKHYGTVGHALDYVFYRGIAGYLVRPLRPILVLLGLALLLSVVREVRRARSAGDRTSPRRVTRLARSAQARGAGLLATLLDTLAKICPRRGAEAPGLSRAARGIRLPAPRRLRAARPRQLEPDAAPDG